MCVAHPYSSFSCNSTLTRTWPFHVQLVHLAQQFHGAPSYSFDCTVGSFVERRAYFNGNGSSDELVSILTAIEKRCFVSYQPGAHYADFLKTLHPMVVRRARYGFVLVLLDDVRLGSFHLPNSMALATAHRIGVLSPLVKNALWVMIRHEIGIFRLLVIP